ncbi:MAG: hypothetical protein OEZ13_04235 [Spirochaetia bacterium]|nr:hypothetical protein [Spirochaetia bacterium]
MGNTISNKENNKKEKIAKAAKILMALGEDTAAQIIKHIDPESMEAILREIMHIRKLDQNEKEELLEEFQRELKKNEGIVTGGKEEAKRLLEKALGPEKALRYLEKLNKNQTAKSFHEFEEYPEETLAQVLSQEMPQTVALVLSYLTPRYAAVVLKLFDNNFRAQIAKKIAAVQKVHPDTLSAVYKALSSKLERIEKEEIEEIRGEDKLSAILGFLDAKSEENILKSLENENPEMAERIKARLFMFEDLVKLKQQEIRKIFEQVTENSIWAKALKGAGQELIRYILSSVSVNRSSDIIDDMKILGAMPLSEIESNRRVIMKTVETLEKEGALFLHKEKETFVE